MDGPDDVLGAPPAADKLTLAVARARLEAALFARNEPVKVGRYHLLEQVGSGGMGVVWGAWDPELERRVAIKLLKTESGEQRDRILVEGQALAKLSHPNVVAVHDVGVVDDRVYLVMEWVRGTTLRAFVNEPRAVRAIVAAYRAAGEGLAAAHRAGLIHRDFKPDNAVIGDDGRLRVLDFGLARAEGATEKAGTPRYMAPEQIAGTPITPAADQFALCVSLDEALRTTAATVPGWLDLIIKRGCASDPSRRFGSMAELVTALGRDPAKRRARIVAGVAVVVAAAGGAFAMGTRSRSIAVEPCSGASAELAPVWNDARRTLLADHLATLGPYGTDEAMRLTPQIDAYADRWRTSHHDACMARERHELTPQLYERNLACLSRARVSLLTAIDVLAKVPAERLDDAALAFDSLPATDRCLAQTRGVLVAPPAAAIASDVDRVDGELAAASVRALASEPAAVTLLQKLVDDADRLAYPPLAARSYLAYGLALTRSDRPRDAITWLDRAAETALEAGDDVAFVESFARQLYATAITPNDQRPADLATPLASLRIVARVAKRLPPELGAFAQMLLANNVGIAFMADGDSTRAATWFEAAYAQWRGAGDPSSELMFIPSNVALVATDSARQQQLLGESATHFTAALGLAHPLSIEMATRTAMATRNRVDAVTKLGHACANYRRFHPALVANYERCAYELAWLADERGDTATARAAYESIAQVGDPTSPQHRLARVALEQRDRRRDAQNLATAFAQSAEWWEREFVADALLLATNDDSSADSRADLERALHVLEANVAAASQVHHQRRVARVHFQLALVTHERVHVDAALAWYRAAGGYDDVIASLATWDSH
ncbi:MAG: serine/threonine-protein kinase [bacterium]